MKRTLITILSIAALALAGCSAGDADDADEAQNTLQPTPGGMDDDFDPMNGMGIMQSGEYEVYPEHGGHATFDLPTSPDHEHVAPFEEYREQHNLDLATYIVVNVDNRDGQEMLKFPALTAYDEQGTAYEFEHIEDALPEWAPERSWDSDNEQFWAPDGTDISFEEYLEIEQQHDALTEDLTTIVAAAEANSIILAYPGYDLPDEYTRVATITYGLGHEQNAYPAE